MCGVIYLGKNPLYVSRVYSLNKNISSSIRILSFYLKNNPNRIYNGYTERNIFQTESMILFPRGLINDLTFTAFSDKLSLITIFLWLYISPRFSVFLWRGDKYLIGHVLSKVKSAFPEQRPKYIFVISKAV